MTAYSSTGFPLDVPEIDHSTAAFPGQHNINSSKGKILTGFHAAEIARTKAARNETVEIIKTFTVYDSDNSTKTYTIVRGECKFGDAERNVISAMSPLGSALLAAKNGIARVCTPTGLKVFKVL